MTNGGGTTSLNKLGGIPFVALKLLIDFEGR
jgi:hypothetical protein